MADSIDAKLRLLRLNQVGELDPLVSRVQFIGRGLRLVSHEVAGCVTLIYQDILLTFDKNCRLAVPCARRLRVVLLHRIIKKTRWVDDHPSQLTFSLRVRRGSIRKNARDLFMRI